MNTATYTYNRVGSDQSTWPMNSPSALVFTANRVSSEQLNLAVKLTSSAQQIFEAFTVTNATQSLYATEESLIESLANATVERNATYAAPQQNEIQLLLVGDNAPTHWLAAADDQGSLSCYDPGDGTVENYAYSDQSVNPLVAGRLSSNSSQKQFNFFGLWISLTPLNP